MSENEAPYPFDSQERDESTGRIEKVPRAIAVPSVVSGSKPQSIPLTTPASEFAEQRSDEPAPSSPRLPKEAQNIDFGATGNLASSGSPSSIDEADTPTAKNLGASNRANRLRSQAQIPQVPQAPESEEPSGTDVQGDLSGLDNLGDSADFEGSGELGVSGNLTPMSKTSIKIRKEQIQRAKNREIAQKRKRIARIARRIIFTVVFLVTLAAVGFFSAHRWGMHDDVADIQGTWQIEGSSAKIKISEDKIRLEKDVSYNYTIDTNSKTLTFDFGQLLGSGRYRFSVDRNKLSLMDGSYNTTDTLVEDIPWTVEALWNYIATSDIDSPNLGEGSITLDRVTEE